VVDRLISFHFHFSITASDVLYLLLAPVAPIWWKVGILIFITYTRFDTLDYDVHYLGYLQGLYIMHHWWRD
jgi:hypothetical protein